MDVSGLIQESDTSPLGKDHTILQGKLTGQSAKQVWKWWHTKKSLWCFYSTDSEVPSSSVWRLVCWLFVTNRLEGHTASIFTQNSKLSCSTFVHTSLIHLPWWWIQHVPLMCLLTIYQTMQVIFQMTIIFREIPALFCGLNSVFQAVNSHFADWPTPNV
jgi:hypothetical protein